MNRSYWSGHILQFETRALPVYDATSGARLLIVVFIMEVLLGPRLALAQWIGAPIPTGLSRIVPLAILALVLLQLYARVKISDVGLYPWKEWTATERWYFLQTIVLANVVFAVMLLPKLSAIFSKPALWRSAMIVLITQLLWGMYQELIYRGILQTELVRRWGAWAGILVSNMLFTFGPLHFYHFRGIAENPSSAWIFAAIFGIGLFFSVLFHRSGNLWIVGIFHGIGDWYISGLQQVLN